MPPLPAIRVPPVSPSQNAVAGPSNSNGKADSNPVPSSSRTLYGGQECSPFFRRLTWSPDGALLITPAGLFEDPFTVSTEEAEPSKKDSGSEKKKRRKSDTGKDVATGPKPTVYIYSRANVARPPIAHLPGHKSGSIAIRFNPVLYRLRTTEAKTVRVNVQSGSDETASMGAVDAGATEEMPMKGAFDLPYRMIYATATHESVYLYDTQQAGPIAIFSNLHYAPFTDLTWFVPVLRLFCSGTDVRRLNATGLLTARLWSCLVKMAIALSSLSKQASWVNRSTKRHNGATRTKPLRLFSLPPALYQQQLRSHYHQ